MLWKEVRMATRNEQNDGCRECRHFRTYKPLSEMLLRELRAEQSTTILSELNRFSAAESERRDAETQARIEVVDQGRMEWPLRPSMSDYCGEREDEAVYYLHEVRNVEYNCKGFQRRDRFLVRCSECVSFCVGAGWADDQQTREELNQAVSRGRDEQSIEQAAQLVQRHQELIDQMKLREANRCLYGLRFADEPPRYLPHCAAYSRENDYVPCLLRNAHNRCPRFESRDAAEAERPAEAAEPAPKAKRAKGFFE
jgi:hypothetical protein